MSALGSPSWRHGWILAIGMLATPFVYYFVTSEWRELGYPLSHSLYGDSELLNYAIAYAFIALGAGVSAILLAAPLSFLLGGRSLLIACCLGVSASFTALPDALFTLFAAFPAALFLYKLPGLATFTVLSWAVAALVARLAKRPAT